MRVYTYTNRRRINPVAVFLPPARGVRNGRRGKNFRPEPVAPAEPAFQRKARIKGWIAQAEPSNCSSAGRSGPRAPRGLRSSDQRATRQLPCVPWPQRPLGAKKLAARQNSIDSHESEL